MFGGVGCLNRNGSFINLHPLFLFSLRIHQPAIKIRHFEPWKIALIVIGAAVAAAITIGLLAYFLAYGKFNITFLCVVNFLASCATQCWELAFHQPVPRTIWGKPTGFSIALFPFSFSIFADVLATSHAVQGGLSLWFLLAFTCFHFFLMISFCDEVNTRVFWPPLCE